MQIRERNIGTNRLRRLGLATVLFAGAVAELAGPLALARAARYAEARDLSDCHELGASAAVGTASAPQPDQTS